MAPYDPLDANADPFRPPAIPTLVGCLHCGQEYESYRIEWRVQSDHEGQPHGFWCCPTPDCGGMGFGFDILPLDPEYQDERGGWVCDSDGEEEEGLEEDWDEGSAEEPGPRGEASGQRSSEEGESLPW